MVTTILGMLDQSWFLWGGATAVVGLVLLGYLLAQRRQAAHDRERLDEARRLGIDTPKGQYPYIDPAICIGCGGCIPACPEGDVLGMVGGLATVVNGLRCIGIGQCAEVCPVEAIEIRVGALRGRADVPWMTDRLETSVPGVFVVGELGGLALIRNAVEQGRDTVRHLATVLADRRSAGQPNSDEIRDVAIVGAGPSGLAAALAAIEEGLSHVVLEQAEDFGGTVFHYPRLKLTHTQPVTLPLYGTLERPEYTKEELLELFHDLIERHRVELRLGWRVTRIERRPEGFRLRSATGDVLARHVLLALGRRGTPRKLGVPGEDLPKVMYEVRDVAEIRDARILCVGGGDSAVEAALGLSRQPGNRVTISYRKEQFFRIKKKNQDRLARRVARGKVDLLLRSRVVEIRDGIVRLAGPEGEVEVENDLVFVMIGGIPPFELLRQSGVALGDAPDPFTQVSGPHPPPQPSATASASSSSPNRRP